MTISINSNIYIIKKLIISYKKEYKNKCESKSIFLFSFKGHSFAHAMSIADAMLAQSKLDSGKPKSPGSF